MDNPNNKQFYQQWWFWLIIGIVALYGITVLADNRNTPAETSRAEITLASEITIPTIQPTSTTKAATTKTEPIKTTATTKAVETTKAAPAYDYSTKSKSEITKGESGIYSYENVGSNYTQHFIIDFDKGVVYYFTDQSYDSTATMGKIVSGTLNSQMIYRFSDYGNSWYECICFTRKNIPYNAIWSNSSGLSLQLSPCSLKRAQSLLATKNIMDLSK